MLKRILSSVVITCIEFPELIVSNLPGPVGMIMRRLYWKFRMAHVGRKVTFGVGVRVSNPKHVAIDDNTWIDDYVILLAGPPNSEYPYIVRKPNRCYSGGEGELKIGKNCHIAQHVTLQAHGGLAIGDSCGVASGARIYSLSHHYRHGENESFAGKVFKFTPRAPLGEQSLISSPVVLGENSALGLNSVVLPGATIGSGSWIASMSVVVGQIPGDVVAGGNPAAVLKAIRGGRD